MNGEVLGQWWRRKGIAPSIFLGVFENFLRRELHGGTIKAQLFWHGGFCEGLVKIHVIYFV